MKKSKACEEPEEAENPVETTYEDKNSIVAKRKLNIGAKLHRLKRRLKWNSFAAKRGSSTSRVGSSTSEKDTADDGQPLQYACTSSVEGNNCDQEQVNEHTSYQTAVEHNIALFENIEKENNGTRESLESENMQSEVVEAARYIRVTQNEQEHNRPGVSGERHQPPSLASLAIGASNAVSNVVFVQPSECETAIMHKSNIKTTYM